MKIVSLKEKENNREEIEFISFDDDVIEKVSKWIAEDSYLDMLLIKLMNKEDDSIIEIVSFRVGFRREEITTIQSNDIEISVSLFNGKPIKFKGVNIHEHNEKT